MPSENRIPRGVIYALFEERVQLMRKLERRSQTVKALVDGDRVTVLVLAAVGSIWAVELIANVANVSGWVKWAHLSVVGTLELAVGYCLFSAARAALFRHRLKHIDLRLTQLIP